MSFRLNIHPANGFSKKFSAGKPCRDFKSKEYPIPPKGWRDTRDRFTGCGIKPIFFFVLMLLPFSENLVAAQLDEATLKAFDAYVRKREAGVEERGKKRNFLWCLERAERRQAAREKGIVVEPFEGKAMRDAGDGVIHDWVGATFIPGVTLRQVVEFVQNYNRHQAIYKPEVVRSKLVSRNGDFFKVYLRLQKTKVITVVLDTNYDVTYTSIDPHRTMSRSYSTRIVEVANPGKSDEHTLPAGDDHGFLWRLYTYWRFAEQEGGVYMECEAISLTRGIPTLLGPIIRPFVKELPLESLERTLRGTRLGLASQQR